MRPSPRSFLLLALAAGSLGACRAKKPAAAPMPEPTTATTDDADRARREAEERARREAADRERLERERLAREAAERTRAVLEAPVYFALDASDLDRDSREQLDAKLPLLTQDEAIRMRIVGHADERGADEYNLALGMRRAAATRRFLVQRGIAEGRLEIQSMGEEQPTCSESTEACWRMNRRAEFSITAGAPVARRD